MKLAGPQLSEVIEAALRQSIGEERYRLWFANNAKLRMTAGGLEVGVPNRFFQEWLERSFSNQLKGIVKKHLGPTATLEFRIDPALFRRAQELDTANGFLPEAMTVTEVNTAGPIAKPEAAGVRERSSGAPRPGPIPRPVVVSRFSFDNLIVGLTNQVAVAALRQIAADPRKGHGPIFLQGSTGVGKTHLLKAVQTEILRRNPNARVAMYSAEEFTNLFVEGYKTRNLAPFRKKVRQLDVLLLDDVQFLAGKTATQEELFHTLNALASRGARVVVSGDNHPRKLDKLTDELRSRMVAGTVVRVDPAGREMRVEIINAASARMRYPLPAEVREFLADQFVGPVHELQGALNSLEHHVDVADRPVTLALAREALSDGCHVGVERLKVTDIVAGMNKAFGIGEKDLKARSRTRSVVHPRMLALYLARRHTPASYAEIGEAFGKLRHSTVIAAEKRVRELVEAEAELLLGQRTWRVTEAIATFERICVQGKR